MIPLTAAQHPFSNHQCGRTTVLYSGSACAQGSRAASLLLYRVCGANGNERLFDHTVLLLDACRTIDASRHGHGFVRASRYADT